MSRYLSVNQLSGTDPNRNWGHQWGGHGASKNPCEETYRGSKEFSEVETTAVRNYITAEARKQEFKVIWILGCVNFCLILPLRCLAKQVHHFVLLSEWAIIQSQLSFSLSLLSTRH